VQAHAGLGDLAQRVLGTNRLRRRRRAPNLRRDIGGQAGGRRDTGQQQDHATREAAIIGSTSEESGPQPRTRA
jgi:hypothetical protein